MRRTTKAKRTIKAKNPIKNKEGAVAVFRQSDIMGEVVATPCPTGVTLFSHFTKLPKGKHGFHIHKAGDLRGEGCKGACEHYDKGRHRHGGAPGTCKERHTGDLGNVEMRGKTRKRRYCLKGVSVRELWGRSVILHEKEDDVGRGTHPDSATTGNSGARIGCAIFGRMSCS